MKYYTDVGKNSLLWWWNVLLCMQLSIYLINNVDFNKIHVLQKTSTSINPYPRWVMEGTVEAGRCLLVWLLPRYLLSLSENYSIFFLSFSSFLPPSLPFFLFAFLDSILHAGLSKPMDLCSKVIILYYPFRQESEVPCNTRGS